MQLYHAVLLVSMFAQASALSASSSSNDLNGWYPCSDFTFADEGSSGGQDAECAVYTAPLCYPGICETAKSIDSTVDIFVKRVPAVSDPESATNVWLMQGGPGASSTAMESAMVELHTRLDGAVNVYTMDHRGTGRSTLLDCVAAQVTTTGSPWGSSIKSSEVPACAQALEKKYWNLSSFSMTSAATDMTTFISNYSNGANTIVYGVSYGTALVERVIHLDPPEVTGYVLDGVATSSGASADKFEYFSTWDSDFGDVGDAFLALCATQSECNSRFQTNTLPITLQSLLTNFDSKPKSTCAALVSSANGDQSSEPPSYIDIGVLTHFFAYLNKFQDFADEDNAFESTLLYYLIVFSEIRKLRGKRHYLQTRRILEQERHNTDPNALDGDKKELITFEFATHGTLWTTPLDESDENSETCGMKLLVSYVSSGGDLDGLDKTCVDNMPVFSLTPSITYQYYFLSTNNAYDGVYNASLAALVTSSSSGSGTNTLTKTAKENETYKIVFIVFLVLFVVSSTIAVFFTYRWYQLKHHKAANRDTDDLTDNISISTPAEVASSSPELVSPFSTHRVS
ncbi:hypothetical protein PF005_g21733 [Phytophthora fragariae]|uniref:AB hydrolase-1 domain-containing protein n=1 Tax=Phytophthora fragariae TaxID=53985 RepID=A0A6A3WLJ0_9STRA|nr:hypothetical protein PF007_g21791 [Phytophthora fragariae]KAE9184275.1 hypothetical protein PF005_g21733 [Phytophthora fragariae]